MMREKSKLLSILLVFAILLTMLPVTAFAVDEASETAASQFSDMPDDWSTAALERAVANGLLTGSDGRIMPNESLTRAQMATIIVRAFGASVAGDLLGFTDVKSSDWFASGMAKAYQMGVIKGSDGKMNPNAAITREQVFVILARALKLKDADTVSKTFPDLGEISSWAKGAVYALINSGYVSGSDGFLNPGDTITRAEFAQLLDNTVKQYISTAGTCTSVLAGNVMINAAGVTLKDVKVTGDLIIGDGVGDGEVTLDNVNVSGRLVVRGGGENSIIIRGTSSVSNVIIARVDGAVSVKVEGDANVEVIYVDDGSDDVNVEGTVGTIEVEASDIVVKAIGARVTTINVAGSNSTVMVDANSTVTNIGVQSTASAAQVEVAGTVTNVTTSAAGTQVSGTGTVTKVEAQAGATGARIETPKTEIVVGTGVTGVTGGGGAEISGGSTAANNDTGSGLQTSSGGGGGGGGDDTPATVSVTNVTVTSASTVTFSCPVAPALVAWNGAAVSGGNVSYDAVTGIATVTVPKITATANTLTVGASGYSTATVSAAVTQSAGNLILISTAGGLADAIANQTDGQVWIIKAGNYDLIQSELDKYKDNRYDATGKVATGGEPEWYFPITADGLYIKGEGAPIVTSSVFKANGNWSTQNFITVWGDDVTIDGLKLRCKEETNKTIEVMGQDFKLLNVETIPTTYDDGKIFGGSVYFSATDVGAAALENVKLQAWISAPATVTAGAVTLKNVTVDFRNNEYANYKWEGDRYQYGVISNNNVFVNDASGGLLAKVDNTAFDIQTNIVDKVPLGTVIELAAGKYYVTAALERSDVTLDVMTNGAQIVLLPAETIVIDSSAQLEAAIAGQAADQTWLIEGGDYPLDPHTGMTAAPFDTQTGWYFPILVDDLTIIGRGNPVLYGATTTVNGAWASQNLITVFGDNVTMKALTIMPKVETNKSVEVVGDVQFTIEDCSFTPNTITPGADAEKGGALYFNGSGTAGTKTISVSNCVFNYTYLSFDGVEDSDVSITGNTFQHIAAGAYAIGNTYWGSAGRMTTQYTDILIDDNDFNNVTAGTKIIAARLNETFILSASNRINGSPVDKDGFGDYINFNNLAYWLACKDNKVIVDDVTYDSPYQDVDAYVTDEDELMDAVATADENDMILVAAGIYELPYQLLIETPLTIKSNGTVTIKPAASFVSHPAETYLDNLIEIEGVTGLVSLENLTVMNSLRNGINVVESANVVLKDLVSMDNTAAGLVVNSSAVTAENLSTSGNLWGYGINIDKGASPDPGAPNPYLTLTGNIDLAEDIQIKSDHYSTDITVDTEGVAAGEFVQIGATVGSTTYWTNRPVTLTHAGGASEIYPTIQAAVDAVTADDTIVLAAATYPLASTVALTDKAVNLIGEGKDRTLIEYTGTPINNGLFATPVNSHLSAKISFSGIGFSNTAAGDNQENYVFLSQLVANQNEVSFDDCSFDHFYTTAYFNNIPGGTENNNKITITDCVINNTTWVYSQDDISIGSSPLQTGNIHLSGNTGDSAVNGPEVFPGITVRDAATQEAEGFFGTIQAAVNAVYAFPEPSVETTYTINVAPGTYSENVGIIQDVKKSIILQPVMDGGSYAEVTMLGSVTIDGQGRLDGAESLTVRGFTFDFSEKTSDADIIYTLKNGVGTVGTYNYSHNVTIEDCGFIGNTACDVVAVRFGASGGHENVTITNCTGTDLHSLGQFTSVTGVTVTDCTVSGGKSGLNLNSSTAITIDAFDFTGSEDGIRAGQGGVVGSPSNTTMTISNSSLVSTGICSDLTAPHTALVLRVDAPKNINITDSTIMNSNEGSYDIANTGGLNAGEFTFTFSGVGWGDDGMQLGGLDEATLV